MSPKLQIFRIDLGPSLPRMTVQTYERKKNVRAYYEVCVCSKILVWSFRIDGQNIRRIEKRKKEDKDQFIQMIYANIGNVHCIFGCKGGVLSNIWVGSDTFTELWQENSAHVILRTQVTALFGPTHIKMSDTVFVLLPRLSDHERGKFPDVLLLPH